MGRYKYFTDNIPRWHNEQQEKQLRQEEEKERLSPFAKRILVVDYPDVTLTFKKVFEEANRIGGSSNTTSFNIKAYNDPLVALSEFKPNFYDLMLIDTNMPEMNGFDFCVKAMEIDVNPSLLYVFWPHKSGSIKRTVSIIEHWMLYQ